MRTKLNISLKQIPKNKRRIGLFIFAILVIVSFIILFHLLMSLLILKSDVDITGSMLQSNELATNYRCVSVDVFLYNPGGPRITTVWVEITNQATNVSFSKAESVQIEYKKPIKLTIEFTLDKLIYSGEFDHSVWLTYPNSQD